MGRVPTKRSTRHRGNENGKVIKTKRKTLDYDQVYENNKEEKKEIVMKQATVVDEDKPGLGQYYCVSCARYFADQLSVDNHNSGKRHKKGLKILKTTLPWTAKDAMGLVDNGKKHETRQQQKQTDTNMTTTTTTTTTKAGADAQSSP